MEYPVESDNTTEEEKEVPKMVQVVIDQNGLPTITSNMNVVEVLGALEAAKHLYLTKKINLPTVKASLVETL